MEPTRKKEAYRFSCRTLIGNWLEDVSMLQKKQASFSHRMSTDDAVLKKTESMYDHYLETVTLQAPCDFIKYGAVIQLAAPDIPNPIEEYAGLPMVVSAFLDPNQIRRVQTLSSECQLSVAPSVRPCRRNSFVVRAVGSEDKSGEYLLYGDPFHLQLTDKDENGNTLCLYSSLKMMNLQNIQNSVHNYYLRGEINQAVGVCRLQKNNTNERGMLCLHDIIPLHMMWRCQAQVPGLRYEAEGQPVKSNDRLVIATAANNRLLAAESDLNTNYFGRECGLSLASYKNLNKMPAPQNVWVLQTAGV